MIFKPLKSRKNRMLIISLSISFLVFCVCVFLISEKITAAAVAGISFILLLIIVLETARFGWKYTIDENGILIKRTFKKYYIASDRIESVREISREQASKIVENIKRGKPDISHRGGISSQIGLGRLIGFSSVPIDVKTEYSGASAGRGEKLVLVRKKDGREYLLSPIESGIFVNTYKKVCLKKDRP